MADLSSMQPYRRPASLDRYRNATGIEDSRQTRAVRKTVATHLAAEVGQTLKALAALEGHREVTARAAELSHETVNQVSGLLQRDGGATETHAIQQQMLAQLLVDYDADRRTLQAEHVDKLREILAENVLPEERRRGGWFR